MYVVKAACWPDKDEYAFYHGFIFDGQDNIVCQCSYLAKYEHCVTFLQFKFQQLYPGLLEEWQRCLHGEKTNDPPRFDDEGAVGRYRR